VVEDKDSEIARQKREIESLQQQLGRREAAVKEKEEAFDSLRREVAGLQQELETTRKAQIEKEEQLSREQREKDEQLARSNREVQQLQQDIASIHKRSLEIDEALTLASEETRAVRMELEAATTSLRNLRHDAATTHQRANETQQAKQELEQTMSQLQNMRLDQETAQKRVWSELQDIKGQLADRNALLAKRDNEIARLNHVIKSQAALPIGASQGLPAALASGSGSGTSSPPLGSGSPQIPYPGYLAPRRESNSSTVSSVNGGSQYAAFNPPLRTEGGKTPWPNREGTLPYPER
jgi:chromosome segregation ATPase